MESVPALRSVISNDDALLAVAQHYGIATNLVDFTTEPKVAAFFACHDPTGANSNQKVSCIICLRYAELKELCESVRTTRPDMHVPSAITIDIPELWRIQSQRGVFLEYPFDPGFEKHFFDFDRIVFPAERDPSVLARLIPEEDIYPSQKSDLEMLLDQFFMLERAEEGRRRFLAAAPNLGHLEFESPPDGIEAECFKPGALSVHDSWRAELLAAWSSMAEERWQPKSTAPPCVLRYPDSESSADKIAAMAAQAIDILEQDPAMRAGPAAWTLNESSIADPIPRWLELAWNGLRRWPYTSRDIAEALAIVAEFGTLVTRQPASITYPHIAQQLAEQCFGPPVEIEVEIEDHSYTRGFVSADLLRSAVRSDFEAHLNDEWRPKIKSVRNILQIAADPRRTLDFERFQSLFCTQFVATQVVLRDDRSGKARLFNPARAVRIGLP
jgi:hypothetical protein